MAIGGLDLKIQQDGVAIRHETMDRIEQPSFFAGTFLSRRVSGSVAN
jgi:hypothetical protein